MIPAPPPPGTAHTHCPSCQRPIVDQPATDRHGPVPAWVWTVRGMCPHCGCTLRTPGS